MDAVFAIVGLIAAGILFWLVMSCIRRRGGGGLDFCFRERGFAGDFWGLGGGGFFWGGVWIFEFLAGRGIERGAGCGVRGMVGCGCCGFRGCLAADFAGGVRGFGGGGCCVGGGADADAGSERERYGAGVGAAVVVKWGEERWLAGGAAVGRATGAGRRRDAPLRLRGCDALYWAAGAMRATPRSGRTCAVMRRRRAHDDAARRVRYSALGRVGDETRWWRPAQDAHATRRGWGDGDGVLVVHVGRSAFPCKCRDDDAASPVSAHPFPPHTLLSLLPRPFHPSTRHYSPSLPRRAFCDHRVFILRLRLRVFVVRFCPYPPDIPLRLRARRFDREIAEEARRARAPVFVDDDDYPDYHSDPYAGPTAYADHSEHYSGPTVYSDPAAHSVYSDPAAHSAYSDPAAHTECGYPASDAVHSGGTPSNYMYPSGYSDLGFSDVSSHGTYAQPPMEGQYNPGSYAAYGAAGVGAAGAYEMTGFRNSHQPQQGVVGEWHPGQQQQEWGAPQGGHVYPGEEHSGYPPTATTTNSSGPDVLGRSKSGGGSRSLVDAYPAGTAPAGAAHAEQAKQYADGYVSQYQTHSEDMYGGLDHGHVVHDESEDESDGRRVLKARRGPTTDEVSVSTS
ncbi:hypothetical protein B0H17DRAFT_1146803 [Mycena rosella]|uniref:Uncharacterized protein n=1 Tax=Mycena rosella TaxID=1033263 RepID=A0AAD7CQL1_MYCRO|nr:hypothetical protein B0H17DRAFT_1146803 [Mycena rosella]